jgi:para-nitrobenzyl esterase
LHNDVYHFRGIPYGADTSGKNRFMPPQKPEPWNNVFPAVWWGNSAPQILDNHSQGPMRHLLTAGTMMR